LVEPLKGNTQYYIKDFKEFETEALVLSNTKNMVSDSTEISPSSEVSESNSDLISINSANKDSLKSLTGIGESYATKIIEKRPYSHLEDLTDREILSASLFEKIKPFITL
jgi:DNA uptake protein ComE-like DNA-binding protein